MYQYREGKVKSTGMTGVKQFLKPDAYKQSELQGSGIRDQGSEPLAAMPAAVQQGASLAVAVLILHNLPKSMEKYLQAYSIVRLEERFGWVPHLH